MEWIEPQEVSAHLRHDNTLAAQSGEIVLLVHPGLLNDAQSKEQLEQG